MLIRLQILENLTIMQTNSSENSNSDLNHNLSSALRVTQDLNQSCSDLIIVIRDLSSWYARADYSKITGGISLNTLTSIIALNESLSNLITQSNEINNEFSAALKPKNKP